MLIRNYGLFWKRERVFWGRGSNAGHLKGVRSISTTGAPVDFRDQQGIYVLYDDAFKLVYVGQAGRGNQRLFTRLRQHRTDQLADRWTRFSWFGIRWVLNGGALSAEAMKRNAKIPDVLNHIEAILIAASEPPHNRQGGRFGDQVSQYLQFFDEDNLGPEIDDMIRDIYEARIKNKTGH